MNTIRPTLAAAAFGVLLALAGCSSKTSLDKWKAATSPIPEEKDRLAVQSTIVDFSSSASLVPYFEKSYGAAIFPTVGRAGIGVGGAHGKGWVFARGKLTGETYLNQVTVGFQLGGQTFSQAIFFENEAAYNSFTSGRFEFGAQASAVAVTVGASAQASTAGGTSAGAGGAQMKRNYTNGMAVFTLAKGGLMYEAAVGGQKFSFRPTEKK